MAISWKISICLLALVRMPNGELLCFRFQPSGALPIDISRVYISACNVLRALVDRPVIRSHCLHASSRQLKCGADFRWRQIYLYEFFDGVAVSCGPRMTCSCRGAP